MSSLYSFFRRHRRKLIWGGAAVGGLVIAARIVERQIIKSREEEGRLALEKVRKQNHFESTESTCNSTLAHLLHELKLSILQEYNTNILTDALRDGPSGDEKVRIWQEIKILSFCRTSAYIIAFSFIGVLLRVQLNVLAGHLFNTRVSVSTLLNNNRDCKTSSPSSRVQEHYLQLSKYFQTEGFSELCQILFVIVKQSVDSIPLQEMLKISDLEKIFQQVLHSLNSDSSDRNLFLNPGKFLLSSSKSPSDLKTDELDLLSVLVSETLEILESDEVMGLTRRISQQGFAFITDKLAETFVTAPPQQTLPSIKVSSENPGTSSQENAPEVLIKDTPNTTANEFTSPCAISLPLVKLLPVLLSVLQEEEDEEDGEDEWIQHIIMNVDLKILGANIYETFCFHEKEELGQDQSWTQLFTNSVSRVF